MLAALRPSTQRQYNHHVQVCRTYVEYDLGLEWILPLRLSVVASFLAHLYSLGHSHGTITTYCSAIAYYHKIRNISDPMSTFYITKLLQGIKRSSKEVRSLKPISKQLLHTLVDSLPFVCQDIYDRVLYRALMLFMYYGCLRVGEAIVSDGNDDHTITLGGLQKVIINGKLEHILVTLTTFKYHYAGKCQLRLSCRLDRRYCPVQALSDYLMLRPKVAGLVFVNTDGRPINRNNLASILRQLLIMEGLDSSDYSTHSFRIGRTTDLAMDGIPAHQIKLIGRWASDAYKKYIRPSLLHLPN